MDQINQFQTRRKESNKKYYEKNKEGQKERCNKRALCEICNKDYRKNARKQHDVTQFHQNCLKNLELS